MATWGNDIVIAEPAPALAYPARYLAPTFDEDDADAAVIAVPLGLVFGGALIFGAAGGGVGEIAAALFGDAFLTPVWVVFDLLLVAAVATSYTLVARYGLRLPPAEEGEPSSSVAVLAARGNVAWKCLPHQQQEEHAQHLRATNAAARLLLVDAADTEAQKTLRENSDRLHVMALTLLPTEAK